jgi:hypothetical protein
MEEMLEELGFYRSDKNSLINIAYVDKVVDPIFGAGEVLFKDSSLIADLAKIRIKSFKTMFPSIPVVRALT